jgi:hypothetical protein
MPWRIGVMMFIFGMGGSTKLKLSILLRGAFREIFPSYTKRFVNSNQYWNDRYKFGGTSGKGSRGKVAIEKAAFVEAFCKKQNIDTIVEYGCGDGFCASLINVKRYIGFDISDTAISFAKDRCAKLKSHTFFNYSNLSFDETAYIVKTQAVSNDILNLSMDVIFHLVEDEIFEKYVRTLSYSPAKYTLILSSDHDGCTYGHYRDRSYSHILSEKYGLKLKYTHAEQIAGKNFKVFEREPVLLHSWWPLRQMSGTNTFAR